MLAETQSQSVFSLRLSERLLESRYRPRVPMHTQKFAPTIHLN